MFEDLVRDTWFYQHILEQGLEQGEERGLEKGREQDLDQGMQLSQPGVIQARFPDVVTLAQQRIETAHDTDLLQQLITKMTLASTAEEARRSLLEITGGNA